MKMKKCVAALLLCSILSGCGNVDSPKPETTPEVGSGNVVENIVENETADPAANVSYEELMGDTAYVIKFQNENDMDILLEARITFKDADGNIQGTAFDSIFCFQKQSSGVLAFETPHTETEYLTGITAEVSLSASETGIFAPESSSVDKITMANNKTVNEGVAVSCQNISDKQIDNVRLMAIFYSGDKPVDFEEYVYLEFPAGGSFDYEFMRPYDLILGELDYDTYEVYVLSAFDDNY